MSASIVAIKGIPREWNIRTLNHKLGQVMVAKKIQSLNYDVAQGDFKTAYITVFMSPHLAVKQINSMRTNVKLVAYIPTHVPANVPVGQNRRSRKAAREQKWAAQQTPAVVLQTSHREVLDQIQRKFLGLAELSKKTKHKLLDEISMELFRRVKSVMDKSRPDSDCYAISEAYRNTYPHNTDFKLIESTLHSVEDACCVPRTRLVEKELLTITTNQFDGPDSYEDVSKCCNSIANRITTDVDAYVAGLPSEETEADTAEEKARKHVARHLKKMGNNISGIIHLLISDRFPMPLNKERHKNAFASMRIYGEPFLPGPEVLDPILKKFCPLTTTRSRTVYNMMSYSVPPHQFKACVNELEGKTIGGAKLVVRPSYRMEYKAKADQICKAFSIKPHPCPAPSTSSAHSISPAPEDMDYDEEDIEDWGGVSALYN